MFLMPPLQIPAAMTTATIVCSENADKKTGYLLNMEYYTVMNNLPSIKAADGTVDFVIF